MQFSKHQVAVVSRGGSRVAARSKMERFVIIVNDWKSLTIITKCSILNVVAPRSASGQRVTLFNWSKAGLFNISNSKITFEKSRDTNRKIWHSSHRNWFSKHIYFCLDLRPDCKDNAFMTILCDTLKELSAF